MSRRIPNGASCLFQAAPGGSRQGKIVLVQHRDGEGWQHKRIKLVPMSSDSRFMSLVLVPRDEGGAEWVAVVG